jgi:hypothetical protein
MFSLDPNCFHRTIIECTLTASRSRGHATHESYHGNYISYLPLVVVVVVVFVVVVVVLLLLCTCCCGGSGYDVVVSFH